jgi:hypothetical protein
MFLYHCTNLVLLDRCNFYFKGFRIVEKENRYLVNRFSKSGVAHASMWVRQLTNKTLQTFTSVSRRAK